MQTDDILDLLRPLVLVVDADATITGVRGGFGGFLGLDPQRRVGSSVFDFIAPQDVDELATYFLESTERSSDDLTLTLPFRVTISGGDGVDHPADIIPTGVEVGGETTGWVVVVVPLALSTAATRSLDAEMAGAPRDQVRRLLTEELAVDNTAYGSRWFLLNPEDLSISTSRDEDRAMADVLVDVVARGWRPWAEPGASMTQAFAVDGLDPAIGALAAARGWRKLVVAPVRVDHEVVAVYFQLGRVPDSLPLGEVNSNVRARIQRLVDVTALLITRWQNRDRLLAAASRDALTGLANRATFSVALDRATGPTAVLYLDVDHFKSINDRLGHQAGDDVLVELGRRVQVAVGPNGLVARFGGDEFVVLLEGASSEDAQAIAERVVTSANAPMPDIEGLVAATVSVGLAIVGAHGDAVNAADRAMLQAKHDGRGRLVVDAGVDAAARPRTIEPDRLGATRLVYDSSAAAFAEMVGTTVSPQVEAALDRALLEAFAEDIRNADQQQVLDLGCGVGRVTSYLAERGVNVRGVDLSPGMVDIARSAHPSLRFEVGTLTELSAGDGTVTAAVAWYSIIHTPLAQLPAVWSELDRVLVSGGDLLIAFQAGPNEEVVRDAAYGSTATLTLLRHDVDDVARSLTAAGFDVRSRVLRQPELPHETTPQAFLRARSRSTRRPS